MDIKNISLWSDFVTLQTFFMLKQQLYTLKKDVKKRSNTGAIDLLCTTSVVSDTSYIPAAI